MAAGALGSRQEEALLSLLLLPSRCPCQAKEAGRLFKDKHVDYVLTSPFVRCLQTSSEIVAQLGLAQGRWLATWPMCEVRFATEQAVRARVGGGAGGEAGSRDVCIYMGQCPWLRGGLAARVTGVTGVGGLREGGGLLARATSTTVDRKSVV